MHKNYNILYLLIYRYIDRKIGRFNMDYMCNPDFNCKIENKFTLLFTCTKGLEYVVLAEIESIYSEIVVHEITRGKLIVELEVSLEQVLELKCVDNIYLFISKLCCGKTKNDLKSFCDQLRKVDISIIEKIYNRQDKKIAIWVNASREGKQTFSRFDIARGALNALNSRKSFVEGKEEKHDLEFRVDLLGHEAIISLKLTSSQFRFRSIQRNFSVGAIRPTIAHSMIWLSKPQKTDIFYDPCCGSGTIINERQYYPAKKIIGTDIDEQAVMMAKNNVSANVIVYQADATKMKMNDQSVSKIVSNIPWDVQIKLDNIYKFYYDFLSEVKRVIRSDGKMILLTDKNEELLHTCKLLYLQCEEITTLSLHGLQPTLFELKMDDPI